MSKNCLFVIEWPNREAFYALMRFITSPDHSNVAWVASWWLRAFKAVTDRKTALMLFDIPRALLAPYTETAGAMNIEGARLKNC